MAVLFIALAITMFVVINAVNEYSALYYTPSNESMCPKYVPDKQPCTVEINLQ